jgi:uncharacterized protein (DUF362 family)/Pyruvate/2-oxoacid:ferredoxin oxidoreductase delta subunit
MSPSISLIHQPDYDDRAVYRAIRRAVDLLGGIDHFVRPGERILLKPNLLSPAPPEKAITTHPAVVRAAIELVREAGGYPLIGDSPGMASLAKAAGRAGIQEVAERAGVELIDFDQPREVKVLPDSRFKRIEVAQAALEADGIINLPKLKTHSQMTLTLSVKNMFGCIPGKRKAQWHLQAGVDRELFAQMLVELFLVMKPRLNILDGILGMEGDGPGNGGSPRWIHLLAASEDGVGLDRAVAELLSIPLPSFPVLQAAQRRGLLPQDFGQFQIVGESLEDLRPSAFLPPRSLDLGWGIPPLLHRALRGALTARPRIDAAQCALCYICSQACPSQAIREDKGKLVIEERRCIRCFCCQELCPEGAVKTKEGWATGWLRIKR